VFGCTKHYKLTALGEQIN